MNQRSIHMIELHFSNLIQFYLGDHKFKNFDRQQTTPWDWHNLPTVAKILNFCGLKKLNFI